MRYGAVMLTPCFFMSMSLQTNTPQNLHGNFTHGFSLAGTVRSTGDFRLAEVCVELPGFRPLQLFFVGKDDRASLYRRPQPGPEPKY